MKPTGFKTASAATSGNNATVKTVEAAFVIDTPDHVPDLDAAPERALDRHDPRPWLRHISTPRASSSGISLPLAALP